MASVSVILTLSPQALSAGRLAGQAEIVSTGEQQVVRDATELLGFLQAHVAPAQAQGPVPPTIP